VNPEIVEREGEIVWEEGCLSVPDLTTPVTRARRVVVRAWTPEEREIEVEADELLAVALQHEIDHLEGTLLVDRLSRLKRDLYRAGGESSSARGAREAAARSRSSSDVDLAHHLHGDARVRVPHPGGAPRPARSGRRRRDAAGSAARARARRGRTGGEGARRASRDPRAAAGQGEGSAFEQALRALAPDLVVVAAYGRILPRAILELPSHGCINVHASLLPRHRGAAPITWAILAGDHTTGVTTMNMAEEMDAGDILLQRATPIGCRGDGRRAEGQARHARRRAHRRDARRAPRRHAPARATETTPT
jgi:methionyl-tRNA formyltransferase